MTIRYQERKTFFYQVCKPTCNTGFAASVTGKLRFPADMVMVCTPWGEDIWLNAPGICDRADGSPGKLTTCWDRELVPAVAAEVTLMTWMTSGLAFSTATILAGWDGRPLALLPVATSVPRVDEGVPGLLSSTAAIQPQDGPGSDHTNWKQTGTPCRQQSLT